MEICCRCWLIDWLSPPSEKLPHKDDFRVGPKSDRTPRDNAVLCCGTALRRTGYSRTMKEKKSKRKEENITPKSIPALERGHYYAFAKTIDQKSIRSEIPCAKVTKKICSRINLKLHTEWNITTGSWIGFTFRLKFWSWLLSDAVFWCGCVFVKPVNSKNLLRLIIG